MNTNYPQRLSFSILSQFSRNLNSSFGDTTGRSIAERTGHGMKKTFNFNMSDEAAADLAHVAMVALPMLLRAQNPWAKFFGGVLVLGLFASYQNGKHHPFPTKRLS